MMQIRHSFFRFLEKGKPACRDDVQVFFVWWGIAEAVFAEENLQK
jgi:hypothetical protein